ncbi:hypothetical protein AB0C13_25950 [Streptomyces sp. NPDC049099]
MSRSPRYATSEQASIVLGHRAHARYAGNPAAEQRVLGNPSWVYR